MPRVSASHSRAPTVCGVSRLTRSPLRSARPPPQAWMAPQHQASTSAVSAPPIPQGATLAPSAPAPARAWRKAA